MHIHNAIVVLQEILPVFPVSAVNSASGKAISEAMAKCIEVEHREDLKILAGAYNARFLKAKAIWEAPQVPTTNVSKVFSFLELLLSLRRKF
jgi:THO complex subunit 2